MRVLIVVSLLVLIQQPSGNVHQSDRPHQPHGDSKSAKQDSESARASQVVIYQQNSDHKQEQANYGVHLDSIFTGIIALFTVLTFFIYREQLRASKVSERAWIVADSPTTLPIDIPDTDDRVQILFVLQNRGRTPAWLTATGSRAQLVTPEKPLASTPEYDWAKPFSSEGTVVPPDARIEQGFDITLANLSYINIGVSTLYVFGVAKYLDIYGEKHETKYSFVFRPRPTATNPAPRGFYIEGPKGYNSAD